MQNKLFIGNISFKMTEADIRELFTPFGEIEEIVIPTDRDTRRPRGFAFLTFESEQSAKEALAMDGKEVSGRKIRVNIATGKKRTGGGSGRGDHNSRQAGRY
jgi:cold-inducible RNA-binding protein